MESFKDSAESLADSTVYILICVDSVDFVFSKCLCSMDCFTRFAPSQRRQWRGLFRQLLRISSQRRQEGGLLEVALFPHKDARR